MAETAADLETNGPPSRAGGLAIAAAIVAFGFLGSRLLGVLRTVVIADAFGSQPELGAYWVAFRVPDLIFQVLAGATLGSAFIPVFARIYRREGTEQAWRLASNILTLVTAATAALCAVAFVFAPLLVPLLAPGLGKDVGRHDELTDKAVELTRLMLLSPLFFSVSGMVTGILNGRQQFLLPAIAPMLYNLAIIFGAVALSGPWGVEGLAAGVVIGSALHLVVQLPGLVRERMRFRVSFAWAASTREVARLMGPRVVGLAAAQVNFLITMFFATKLGSAEISDMTYAWLLAGLPLAIFGMAISTAVFPRLAEHAADDDHLALREAVSRALRVIMFLTIPAALGLALLREPVTALLLQRGEFAASDTAIVAAALAFYCLGIVPQAGIEIHSRGFYAVGDTRTPVMLAVVAVAVNLALSALFWDRFEHRGLAFAVSAAAWAEWLLLYRAYLRRLGGDAAADLGAIGRFAVAGGVMALVLAVGFGAADNEALLERAVTAVAGAGAGALAYAGMANLLRVEEMGEAMRRLRGRLGRGARTATPDEVLPELSEAETDLFDLTGGPSP
ncbi:MAG: murein biosynthesis integral membrane protein MurJ [Chloroflexi bacterium]|nr:murein biosynthesis integral membrane protein MurJ [Chloroflexota bacterium]